MSDIWTDGLNPTYSELMMGEPAHLILTIDTKQPIEVGDFVSSFTALASQYDRFIRAEYPDLAKDAEIYVREVRAGSIVVDLLPWATAMLPSMISDMEQILVLEQFVKTYGRRIGSYFGIGGREKNASKSDLNDFTHAVAAIANDPDASATLQAAYFEDGKKKIKTAFKFTTPQARQAQEQLENHKQELERNDVADHARVLMVFRQCNVRDVILGKRTGETVLIEDVSLKELPLIYASDLAEQRIKHEIREAEDNVFKKGFVVDVNVQLRGGKPVAYRVTNLHQVIDIPDDD